MKKCFSQITIIFFPLRKGSTRNGVEGDGILKNKNKNMIRLFLMIGILLSSSFSFLLSSVYAEERYFVVTAYYSPLPDQKYYLKGNYEAEIRLNGR